MLTQEAIKEVVEAVERMVEGRNLANKHRMGRMAISRRMQALRILHILGEIPDLLVTELQTLFGSACCNKTLSKMVACGAVVKAPSKIRQPKEAKTIYRHPCRYSAAENALAILEDAMEKPWW